MDKPKNESRPCSDCGKTDMCCCPAVREITPSVTCTYCRTGNARIKLTDGTWAHQFEDIDKRLAWCEPCTSEPLNKYGSYYCFNCGHHAAVHSADGDEKCVRCTCVIFVPPPTEESMTKPVPDAAAPTQKPSYIGAPACFALETACRQINEAFGDYGCYVVGSALDRPDWRDVDVRFIMSDEQFDAEFPHAGQCWEQDAKWLLLTVAISERLSKVTGLPIDFQIQPQTHANERHKGKRNAVGLLI